MKKFILTLIIFITPFLVKAQVPKNDLMGKIGISLYGGLNMPVSGYYSSNIKTTDYLTPGSQFGIGLSYFITKGFGLEGTLYAGYNFHSVEYRPMGKSPVWVNLSSNINVVYNFGHMFRKPLISPFIRLGIGTYQWVHFEDGLIGSAISKNNNNHKVNSFGYNIGIGGDYSLNKKITVGFLLEYNKYFPKYEDVNSSANERTQHSTFVPQLKVSYYIPTWH